MNKETLFQRFIYMSMVDISFITETLTQSMESVLHFPTLPPLPEINVEALLPFVEESLVILSNINIYWRNLFGMAVSLWPDQLEPLYFFSAGKIEVHSLIKKLVFSRFVPKKPFNFSVSLHYLNWSGGVC